jgi:hypothetical protein
MWTTNSVRKLERSVRKLERSNNIRVVQNNQFAASAATLILFSIHHGTNIFVPYAIFQQ